MTWKRADIAECREKIEALEKAVKEIQAALKKK